MKTTVNRIRSAINATLIRKAEGADFDRLARFHGLPRPPEVQIRDWRHALLAAAGPRGVPGTTRDILRGALRAISVGLEVQLDPAQPTLLLSSTAAFTQALVPGFVTVSGYGTFYAVGPVDVDSAGADWLQLCTDPTPLWDLPDWSGLGAVATASATFWCFEIMEPTPGPDQLGEAGTVVVMARGGPESATPPHYLQATADERPEGQPDGGHLQADAAESTDLIVGPHPLYLPSSDIYDGIRGSLKPMLNSGIHCRIVQRPTYDTEI